MISIAAFACAPVCGAATIGYWTFPTATALPAGGIVNVQAYSVQTAIGLGNTLSFNQSYYDPASGKTPTVPNGGALATALTAALPAASFTLATATTTPALPAAPAGFSRIGVISATGFLGPYDIKEVAGGVNAAAANGGFDITLGGNVTKTKIAQNLVVMKIDSVNDADLNKPGQFVVDIDNQAPIYVSLQGGDTPDEEAELLAKALDQDGYVAVNPAGTDEVDLAWNNPANAALFGNDLNITFGMQGSAAGYQLELDLPVSAPEPATSMFLGAGLALIGVLRVSKKKRASTVAGSRSRVGR